ncbi:MAG: LLM class F420-dependent oxidoreductase [Acidimicrobiales bacterium]|jgi:probable F420-dependent oxidoreductase
MNIGVVFPQTEIGHDAGGVRAYAEAAEALGYSHVLAYDHVLGADTNVHTDWEGPYDLHSSFHEPFVLFGFLAGFTSLEVVTGILIGPQRQTALVAKQAAAVDVFTGGKLRLGLGIGWNEVEYEALGKDFANRGLRLEEQIPLLRRLFTEESVTFEGAYERVVGAGLCPLPVQRPIPIWVGGRSKRALRRAGRLADGWFPLVVPNHGLDEAIEAVRSGAEAAGRDPASLGMEGRINAGAGEDELARHLMLWKAAGATHLSVNTMGAGLRGADAHIAAIAAAAEVAMS